MGGGGDLKYPIIYDKNTTDFFNLGQGPLTNTIEATVTEERNGAFYFEAEVLIDDKYELIKENSIIKVDAGHTLKDQRFRIKRITPTDEGTAKIYAEHISYLAQELSLQPDIHLTGSAQVVLGIWKNSIIDKNPFVVDSDVSTVSSTHFDISEVSNAREALGGVKGSILDRWGGEYRFDNYHISLLKKRGKSANTLLAYGRNITDFEQDRNITNTYTSVYPFAKYTDDNQKEHLVTIPGYLVDSEHVNKYPNRKALPVDFSNEFKDKVIPTADKLKKLAEAYIKDNEVGIPKVSIKLSFLDLSKTLDYKELAPLEELSLCDEVRVSYEKLDVNTTAKVIRTVWNVLTESYDEIEIGEKRMTLSSTLNDQSQAIKEIKDQSNYSLIAANGKNTIFYGLYGADGTGQPVATMVGDMWYKPVGEDTEFYIWDGTAWKFIMSTVDNKIIQETIDQLEAESEQIKQDVDKALSEAEQARDNAFNAKGIADLADEKSNQALADAEAAREEAFDSKAIADEAKLESSKALQKGNHNEVEISKLEGQLKVTNSKVEGNTTNLLNLKLESDELSSSVSKTQYELENLSATGINLLNRKDWVEGYYRTADGGIASSTQDMACTQFILTTQKKFVLQVDVSQADLKTGLVSYIYFNGDEYVTRVNLGQLKSGLNIIKFEVPENSTQIKMSLPLTKTGLNNSSFKLETGIIATDINVSFDDIMSKTEFSTFEQTYRGFQSNVEGQFAVAKNDTQKVSDELSNTNSKLDNVDKKTNNNANKLDNVDTELVIFKSQQTQMANQINSTVERVENLEIGSVNLLSRSRISNFYPAGPPDQLLLQKNDNYHSYIIPVKKGDVLSFYRGNALGSRLRLMALDEEPKINMQVSEIASYTNIDYFDNFVVDGDYKFVMLVLAISTESLQIENTSMLTNSSKHVKTWSPAPEDLANKSEVTQLSDQIAQTITKTTVLEGQLSQQQSQVNQLSDKLTVNIRDTSSNATKISQLELTTNSMSLTLASVERENGRLNTKVVSLEANLNGFQATVTDDLNGVKAQQTLMSTQMTTTISKVDMIDGKVSKQQTEITQLSNSISSIVSEFEGGNLFNDPDFNKKNPLISSRDSQTFVNYVTGGLKIKCDKTNTGEFIVFPCAENLTLDTNYEIELTANSDCRIEPGSLSASYSGIDLKSGEKRTIKGANKYVDANKFYIAVSIMSDITIHSLKVFGKTTFTKQSEFHQFSDKFLFQVGTNKLMITSETTYIENATIKTAMIQDLSVSNAKIQDASISNAKIINLDASKITTGYLNSNRIQARSITANHLAVDAITVGFNNSSTNVKLSGYNIEFLDSGKRSAQITSTGMEFWDGNVYVGWQGRSYKTGNSSVRGITNNLESSGDFISWGYRQNSSSTSYTSLLTLDPKGKFYNDGKKGIRVSTDIHFDGLIGCADGTTHMLKFGTVYFNNFNYPALLHKDGKVGVIFGSGELYLMRNSTYVSLSSLMK